MEPDLDRLRAAVEHLAAIERPSASAGEREAAEWISARLREAGCQAEVEQERAHGTIWWPLGLLTATAGLAGLALAPRGPRGRLVATVVAAAATRGIVDDITGGPHWFRRLLPRRSTWNAVARAGDPAGARTLVLVAHHDAAHGGAVFDPRPQRAFARAFPRRFERTQTAPPIMALVVAGPALVAAAAAAGRPGLLRAGVLLCAGSVAAFADIGVRRVVPGANDNLSAVAVLLELARALQEEPVPGLRVLLVSTGSEESFMEGMRGFVARHGAELARSQARVLCVECVGSPALVLLEGEGMLRMNDYSAELRTLVAEAAAGAGVPLRRGLRSSMATDGLISLRAGLATATLASIDRYKMASNYHQQTDTAENVDYATVARAVVVCRAVARALAASGADR